MAEANPTPSEGSKRNRRRRATTSSPAAETATTAETDVEDIGEDLPPDSSSDGDIGKADGQAPDAGGPTQTTLAFDGNQQFLEIKGPFPPMPNGATIEFWARRDNLFTYNSIFESGSGGLARVLNIHLAWANGCIFWDAGGGPNGGVYDRIIKPVDPDMNDGSWAHWAFTKDVAKGEMAIYRNGVLRLREEGKTMPISESPIAYIGKSFMNQHWGGWLAEFRIWDRARTDVEIAAAMNKRLTGSEPGLIALWPLDRIEPDGTTRDLVGRRPAAVQGAVLSDHRPPTALPAAPESPSPDPGPPRKSDMARKKSAAPTETVETVEAAAPTTVEPAAPSEESSAPEAQPAPEPKAEPATVATVESDAREERRRKRAERSSAGSPALALKPPAAIVAAANSAAASNAKLMVGMLIGLNQRASASAQRFVAEIARAQMEQARTMVQVASEALDALAAALEKADAAQDKDQASS